MDVNSLNMKTRMENQGIAQAKEQTPCTKCERLERTHRRTKTVYVGKDGWPVTGIMNAPIRTFLRRLIHSKKKMSYGEWLDQGGCKIDFS